MISFAKLESIEDEDASDVKVLEGLQFFLDVAPQSKWEATQRAKKGLAGRLVHQMLLNVMRRIDTDDGTFKSGEGEGLSAAHSPVIEGTDWREHKVRLVSSTRGEQELY